MISLRTVLPNFTIAMNISFLVVIYLDKRNPMMGFLVGWPFLILAGLTILASIATAVVLYKDWRSGVYERKSIRDAAACNEQSADNE